MHPCRCCLEKIYMSFDGKVGYDICTSCPHYDIPVNESIKININY